MMNKSKTFSFRISEKDLYSIKNKAEKAKLTMTDYITNSALNKDITVIHGFDEVQKELKFIGKNINQLTTLCNMGRIQCLELSEVKEDFKKAYQLLLDISEAS